MLKRLVTAFEERAFLSVLQGDRAARRSSASRRRQRAGESDGSVARCRCTAPPSARRCCFDHDRAALERLLSGATFQQLAPNTATGLRRPRRRASRSPASAATPIADEELEIGLVAVAAPVRDACGRIVAALNVSGPKFRLGARLDEVGDGARRRRGRICPSLAGARRPPTGERDGRPRGRRSGDGVRRRPALGRRAARGAAPCRAAAARLRGGLRGRPLGSRRADRSRPRERGVRRRRRRPRSSTAVGSPSPARPGPTACSRTCSTTTTATASPRATPARWSSPRRWRSPRAAARRPTEFLEAVLVGYEVAIRAGVLLHAREAQYHASAAWGSLGVAVAAGRLLGLDAAQLRPRDRHRRVPRADRAHVARRRRPRDDEGHLRLGRHDRHERGLLAARGFTGLDSEFMLTADDLALGERWEVLELYLKPYPCCRWSQPAIDAALRLRPDPTRIESVVVRTFAAADLLSRRRPTNTEEMQYSLVWPIATALARGASASTRCSAGSMTRSSRRSRRPDPRRGRPGADVRVPGAPTDRARGRARATALPCAPGRSRRGASPTAPAGRTSWPARCCGSSTRSVALPLAVRPVPPATSVSGRSRDELVRLLAFVGAATPDQREGDADEEHGGVHPGGSGSARSSARDPPFAPAPARPTTRSAFPAENFADLRRLGLVALTAPERLGGARALDRRGVHAVLRADRGARVGRQRRRRSSSRCTRTRSASSRATARRRSSERFLAEIVATRPDCSPRSAARRAPSGTRPACTRRSSYPTATAGA